VPTAPLCRRPRTKPLSPAAAALPPRTKKNPPKFAVEALLLWHDVPKSAAALAGATALYLLLEWSGIPLLTWLSNGALAATLGALAWAIGASATKLCVFSFFLFCAFSFVFFCSFLCLFCPLLFLALMSLARDRCFWWSGRGSLSLTRKAKRRIRRRRRPPPRPPPPARSFSPPALHRTPAHTPKPVKNKHKTTQQQNNNSPGPRQFLPPALTAGVDESAARLAAEKLRVALNALFSLAGRVLSGDTPGLSLRAAAFFFVAARVGRAVTPAGLLYLAVVALLTVPKAYDLRKDEIDRAGVAVVREAGRVAAQARAQVGDAVARLTPRKAAAPAKAE